MDNNNPIYTNKSSKYDNDDTRMLHAYPVEKEQYAMHNLSSVRKASSSNMIWWSNNTRNSPHDRPDTHIQLLNQGVSMRITILFSFHFERILHTRELMEKVLMNIFFRSRRCTRCNRDEWKWEIILIFPKPWHGCPISCIRVTKVSWEEEEDSSIRIWRCRV